MYRTFCSRVAIWFALTLMFSVFVSIAVTQSKTDGPTRGETTPEPAGTPHDAPMDMDGDGRTDYVVVRNTGGGPSGQITWFVRNNATNSMSSLPWGITGDRYVPADYDGDGNDDIAVWRQGSGGNPQATFYILESGTNTIRAEDFGLTGDDASIVGDYNGDGTDDVAVYRAGALSGQPSTFYWRPSPASFYTAVVYGQNGDFPAPGDYDGDGKMDFAVQRAASASVANFLIKFSGGGSDATIPFEGPFDRIVPGDYDGDGKSDLCVFRSVGGFLRWTYRPSSGGANVVDTWGNSATDFAVPGDYNGDGRTDYAVWRPGQTGQQATFYIMTPVTRQISLVSWGLGGDYPPANAVVH